MNRVSENQFTAVPMNCWHDLHHGPRKDALATDVLFPSTMPALKSRLWFQKTPARFVGEMYRQGHQNGDEFTSDFTDVTAIPNKGCNVLYFVYVLLKCFLRWWTLTTFSFHFKLYLEKETWENRAVTRDSEPAKQMQNVSKFPALKGCAQKRVAIPNGWSEHTVQNGCFLFHD